MRTAFPASEPSLLAVITPAEIANWHAKSTPQNSLRVKAVMTGAPCVVMFVDMLAKMEYMTVVTSNGVNRSSSGLKG